MDRGAMWRGVPLADMTKEELIGVICELSDMLEREQGRSRQNAHARAVGQLELARRKAQC